MATKMKYNLHNINLPLVLGDLSVPSVRQDLDLLFHHLHQVVLVVLWVLENPIKR